MKKLLFICSRNKWRSLTAETIYKDSTEFIVKSAGTKDTARVKVNSKLLVWADLIFVMEDHHKRKIKQDFPDQTKHVKIIVLNIPDDYKFMDEELIKEIENGVAAYL